MLTREFILAGKAIFTCRSLATGRHYTYQVSRKEFDTGGSCYFVSLLTGPDNMNDYTYLGVLVPSTGDVRLTKASRMDDDSQPVVAIRWLLGFLWTDRQPPNCELFHEGRCGRCGRLLTTPESCERGIGPECAEKLAMAR